MSDRSMVGTVHLFAENGKYFATVWTPHTPEYKTPRYKTRERALAQAAKFFG